MTLLERQLRTIKESGIRPTTISVRLAPGTNPPASLPKNLTRELSLQWSHNGGSLQENLCRLLEEKSGTPLLALDADAVVDSRLLRHIGAQSGSLAARGGDGAESTAVVRLESGASVAGSNCAQLRELADAKISEGTLRELPLQEVPSYIRNLRRELPPYLFRVPDAAKRDEKEHFLFWSNYKGSTDFFTKYVYPPLVWRMVRPLARWRVHPNFVTLISIILTLAAVPVFAKGYWVLGLCMAYGMSVLDSVDGKLARLTFRASWLGNVLDHGLDIVHPPLWYFGWAWALGGGQWTSPLFLAAIVMAIFYSLDRVVVRMFTARTGRSVHAYEPFDVKMRTYISRRNINLPIFTVGLLLGVAEAAFYFIVVWQLVTLAYHAIRVVQVSQPKPA
jgi:phosphatidylglycerophosphate synthase